MKITRNNVVKWLSIPMGLLVFYYQLDRYNTNNLSDVWTEIGAASAWIFLVFAPFLLPIIIRTFIDKFTNKK